MSDASSKGYKFNIANGSVTAVYELKNGRLKNEGIDHNETWSVDGDNIVKSEWEHGRLQTTTYSDLDGDGIFSKGAQTHGTPIDSGATTRIPQEDYKFDITATGAVTAAYEVKHGVAQIQRIDANETYASRGADVVKTEFEHGVTQTTVYSDTDGDGLFSKVSKAYSSTDGASTLAWNGSHHGGDNDDSWSGDKGGDYYHAADGNDVLKGNDGNDDLLGGDGDDDLHGGTGDDQLSGGDGNDDVFAGLGKDVLTGGAGNDAYKYLSSGELGATAATRDVITDFSVGDKIDLSSIDAMTGYRSNDAFKFIGGGADLNLANANGALWFEKGVLYGSTDRDLTAEFQIELTGVTSVAAIDLVL